MRRWLCKRWWRSGVGGCSGRRERCRCRMLCHYARRRLCGVQVSTLHDVAGGWLCGHMDYSFLALTVCDRQGSGLIGFGCWVRYAVAGVPCPMRLQTLCAARCAFGLIYDACMDIGFVTHELLHCCWEAVQCIAAQRIVLHRRDHLHCVDLGWASID